jgi:hypothetical protein
MKSLLSYLIFLAKLLLLHVYWSHLKRNGFVEGNSTRRKLGSGSPLLYIFVMHSFLRSQDVRRVMVLSASATLSQADMKCR